MNILCKGNDEHCLKHLDPDGHRLIYFFYCLLMLSLHLHKKVNFCNFDFLFKQELFFILAQNQILISGMISLVSKTGIIIVKFSFYLCQSISVIILFPEGLVPLPDSLQNDDDNNIYDDADNFIYW